MAQKEYMPDWLVDHPKYQFRDINDPSGKAYEATAIAKEKVRRHVEALVASNEKNI